MSVNNQSLLFIPDITGFTKFVNETELDHSQHIISELLEIIVDANVIGMSVSEIEGDAVLFYKHNEVPSLATIIGQVKHIFLKFHNHLKSYESKRICSCGACTSAINLSLKFIIHRGEIGFTTVKNHKKPFGADLILVHRLLKNNVDKKEYMLFSENFCLTNKNKDLGENTEWIVFQQGATSYKNIGEVKYDFVNLDELHKLVKPALPPPLPKKDKNPIRLDILINANVNAVFEKVTNFDYRLEWNEGVNELNYEPNRVNRIGTNHRCVIGDNQIIDFETTSNNFGEDKKVYGEKIASIPLLKEVVVYYILSSQENGTLLRSEVHFNPQPIIGWIMVLILKKQFKKNLKKSLEAIKSVLETPKPSASVVLT